MRMRRLFMSMCIAMTVGGPALLVAQTKPANATAQCKDGTYSNGSDGDGPSSQPSIALSVEIF